MNHSHKASEMTDNIFPLFLLNPSKPLILAILTLHVTIHSICQHIPDTFQSAWLLTTQESVILTHLNTCLVPTPCQELYQDTIDTEDIQLLSEGVHEPVRKTRK